MRSRIGAAISKIKRLRACETIEEPSSLDIVFHVGGTIISPDYEGVRTGRLSRQRKLLQIQIAVPRALNEKDQNEIEAFIVNALREAIHAAEPIFARAGIPFQKAHYEQLVERMQRALAPN